MYSVILPFDEHTLTYTPQPWKFFVHKYVRSLNPAISIKSVRPHTATPPESCCRPALSPEEIHSAAKCGPIMMGRRELVIYVGTSINLKSEYVYGFASARRARGRQLLDIYSFLMDGMTHDEKKNKGNCMLQRAS
jgi:hypothetical protein